MTHAITVRHNFETAHRLPELGGKCQNRHGHSWWCEITAAAPGIINVAQLLANVAQELVVALRHAPHARVTHVTVHETHVDAAQWHEPSSSDPRLRPPLSIAGKNGRP